MWINRWVLLVGAVLLALPYLIFLGCAFFLGSADWWQLEPQLMVALMSLYLSAITIPLLGGYAFAAERADRSAEFLAYLPPSRPAIVTSKLVLAAGVSLVLILIHWTIFLLISLPFRDAPVSRSLSNQLIIVLCAEILMFGVAWLFSTFATGPALAAGCGILAPLLAPFVIHAIHTYLELPRESLKEHFIIVCLVGGVTAFVCGTAYYLRRFAP
jgi:ABC-type transport system involved in multi-copper enzyme maturation permease subunit